MTTPAQAQAMQRATWVLAMYAARGIVKEEFKKQKIRLADVEAREITAAAREYFDKHPAELIAKAKETVDLWAKQGRFGPRGGFRSR